MKIFIDIGNTNILFGKFDNNSRLVSQLRIVTSELDNSDSDNSNLMKKKILDFFSYNCTNCVIAGVVPDSMTILKSYLTKTLPNIDIYEINNSYLSKIIKIKVKSPEEVGVDRLINALSASKLFKPPLIIIDFGTATTFDLVDSDTAYIGGLICPGVNLSIQSLANKTAKLPLIEFKKVDHLVGQDTKSAIESGLYWGYVSLVKGLINKIRNKDEFKKATIIATGGLSGIFNEDINEIDHFESDLTLKGINYIHNNYDIKK